MNLQEVQGTLGAINNQRKSEWLVEAAERVLAAQEAAATKPMRSARLR